MHSSIEINSKDGIGEESKQAFHEYEQNQKERNIKMIIDERVSERDFGEFEGEYIKNYNVDEFWSYNTNKEYKKAENIRVFLKRIYNFLDDIKEKYSKASPLANYLEPNGEEEEKYDGYYALTTNLIGDISEIFKRSDKTLGWTVY